MAVQENRRRVIPSAFHANEGATGIRRFYLEKNALECCFSFENKRKIFDIHSSFKFATVVTQRHATIEVTPNDHTFDCGFYLHDDRWLESDKQDPEPLSYTLDFVKRTGGEYLSLLELRNKADVDAANRCYRNGELFARVCERLGLNLGRELNVTDDAFRFTSTAKVLPRGDDPRHPKTASGVLKDGYLIFGEGKYFHQFDDQWESRPRYLIHLNKVLDKPGWTRATRFFRLAYRDTASSTNERTGIFSILVPGYVFSNKSPCDRDPQERPTASPLLLASVTNSYSFDFGLRLKVGATINLFILNGCPVPSSLFSKDWHKKAASRFLAHSALRLTCNHEGYRPLWEEQVGKEWREPGRKKFDWPTLPGDDARWAVRANIDAVVAQAYGLTREQYAHVLSTFSHKSYPKAPNLCLAAFDDLTKIGLDAFCKKHDPYHDIPLNTALPKPVINLPIPDAPEQPKKGGKSKGKKDQTQGRLL